MLGWGGDGTEEGGMATPTNRVNICRTICLWKMQGRYLQFSMKICFVFFSLPPPSLLYTKCKNIINNTCLFPPPGGWRIEQMRQDQDSTEKGNCISSNKLKINKVISCRNCEFCVKVSWNRCDDIHDKIQGGQLPRQCVGSVTDVEMQGDLAEKYLKLLNV